MVLIIFLCLYDWWIEFQFIFNYVKGMDPKISASDDTCLVDSGTTHTILKNQKFFSDLIYNTSNVSTIAGPAKIIEGYGRAHVVLPTATPTYS